MDDLTLGGKAELPGRLMTSTGAVHLVEQAELFDDLDAGCELLSIEADRTGGRHTGSTLERRAELRDAICLRLVSGVSQREVCRVFHVGRNTVAKLVERLEGQGKMEPYKKRMARKLGQVIEDCVEVFHEKLEKGLVPVQVLPIAAGIFADKRALLEGEPTSILGRVEKGFDEGEYDRWVASLPSAKAGIVEIAAIDGQSTGENTKGQ